MDIENWLSTFKTAWIEKDIDTVLGLFTENVEYWETPYQQIETYEELKKEWEGIYGQKDISLDLKLFSQEGSKYTIVWKLDYIDKENRERELKGLYLIELNSQNKCYYFLQTFHQNN